MHNGRVSQCEIQRVEGRVAALTSRLHRFEIVLPAPEENVTELNKSW